MDRRARTTFTDLTHPLTADMPVYPGDPEVQVDEVLTIQADGCSVRSLHLGSHSGTHVDAPAHVIAGGRTIDQVAPEELMGDAVVVQLPDLAPEQLIDEEMLGEALRSGPENLPSILLLATGWDRHWGGDDYLRHPVLTEDAASFLVAGGVQVLGVDMASPDGADSLVAHEVLLGADRLIIENLRGLTDLPRHVEFTALPLNITGGDGAPVRAVAKAPTYWTIGEYAFPGRLRDQLIEAILDGEKTTTTSLVEEYLATGEPLPTPGDREIVVNSDGTPNCVLAITGVRVCRLDEVTEEHVRGEGEGYESVAEWRRGHELFWNSPEFRAENPRFVVDDVTEVVCTRFEFLAPLYGV